MSLLYAYMTKKFKWKYWYITFKMWTCKLHCTPIECKYVCESGHAPSDIHPACTRGGQMATLGFSSTALPFDLRQGLSMEPTLLARLAGRWASGPSVFALPVLGLQACLATPGFYMCLGPNSGPHAYAASILSTELSPLLGFIFEKWFHSDK